jgi:adenylate cyclase
LANERVPRRVTAILAADIVGYSRLMGEDDEGTLAQLKTHRRELVDPKVREHQGRIVKTTGDGMLAEFASVVDALRCAVEIQRDMRARNAEVPMEKRIEFRVGLNVGDIIIDGEDIYGDGVNVASRIEGLAESGGICVSGRVYEDTRGKLDIGFDDWGEQQLKNIAWPVRVYRVRLGGEASPARPALALPDQPSIAVLAFENLSGDPQQDYFADGMVEEIIMALSRMRWLFVIARNSSFAYKGRAVDVKQVGRELGVRYVLEGSVRKAGNRVRIAGKLIDASTGAHLWADRYEGTIDDVFDLQDQVTASVVGAIVPKLEQAEIERVQRKPTERHAAYDHYLKGLAGVHLWTREGNKQALAHFYQAIELDENFASAYGMAARCYCQKKSNGWTEDRVQEVPETTRLARRAAQVGRDDALALCTAGFALAYVAGELEDGIALMDRALALNPNLALAWYFSAWGKVWLGEPDAAIERLARAMRLSPQETLFFNMQAATAHAHFIAGRYAEALSWAEAALRQCPEHTTALRVLSASCAFLNRPEQARKAAARLSQLDPRLRISNIGYLVPYRRPDDLAQLAEGLRMAGIPE